eukprot:TRINITY_DN47225_c0_g1_i1.p1 TRINITY_DN47225_c0_g1~~TRINITY_DN47225_c0_g1_i1.p1  ORF type:complete len:181 (+),score=23.93 TRINITY_DN47225_c0_g1_i1:32-574(+)
MGCGAPSRPVQTEAGKITVSICLASGVEVVKEEVLLQSSVASLVELAEKAAKAAISSLVSPRGLLDARDSIGASGLQDGDVVTAILVVVPPGTYHLSDGHGNGYITLGPEGTFRIQADSGFVNGTYYVKGLSLCAKGEFSSNAGPHRADPHWTYEYDLKTFLEKHPPVSDDQPRILRMLS